MAGTFSGLARVTSDMCSKFESNQNVAAKLDALNDGTSSWLDRNPPSIHGTLSIDDRMGSPSADLSLSIEPRGDMSLSSSARGKPGAVQELDLAILTRCKAKDPLAFRVFVDRYKRVVFALLSRLLGHGPHVNDLAQESFLRAFVAFPEFDLDMKAKPSTWLLTIATNVGLDWLKRAHVQTEPIEGVVAIETRLTPEAECAGRELGRAIERAAGKLSPEQRAVFLLAELHDFTLEEIAQALGIPLNTAKTRLLRAKRHMVKLLNAFLGGHE